MGVRRDGGSFVTYTTRDGGDVRVEIEPSDDGFMPVSGERSLGTLEHIFRPAVQAAEALIEETRHIHPHEVKVRFGIKVTGGGEAVVARKSDEGNFEITLSWNTRNY